MLAGKNVDPPMTTPVQLATGVIYPDDGQLMADNTEQFCWIVTIQGG